MAQSSFSPWLHRFAVFTALATLGLVGMGGLVTSHGVGMAVPDWPTSYGYNMFALPISTWLTGGIFHEHTHRLWASFVGVLVVALTRWLGGRPSRLPLAIIGAVEVLAGQALLLLGPDWKGAGHFLSGIGGVILLAALVWTRNRAAQGSVLVLGWATFWLVQLQGLLGGLRVVLDAHWVADVRMGTAFGIFHGLLGQAFLALVCVIALLTSRWWLEQKQVRDRPPTADKEGGFEGLRPLFLAATVLIFLQLIIGATMRHQHAGLAVPDFPLAYGRIWPATDADAVMRYNQHRIEITALNPITGFQIYLHMAHRLMAIAVLAAVGTVAWRAGRGANATSGETRVLRTLARGWVVLILVQAGLGAWIVWSNKAADVATAHVVVGALSLVTGVAGCIISLRRSSGTLVAETASVTPEAAIAERLSAGANP